MKILHAASECFPLAKTGGLGDVIAALPAALDSIGVETRVCLPGYRHAREQLTDVRTLGQVETRGESFDVLEGRIEGTGVSVWLLDNAALFDRPGDPYHDAQGVPWPDNAWRFGCFATAVAQLAHGFDGWRPDVVHLHDWQSALAAAWLASSPGRRPPIMFTIHNLAYQGVFGRRDFDQLGLPAAWWHTEGVEFWGGFSFMKAGLNFSDAITTVSPTYALEICTPAFGHGLDGVLRARGNAVRGIVNGIDAEAWDPATDRLLQTRYRLRDVVAGKRTNKMALQLEIGLPQEDLPLLIFIGRFAEQKGADLILAARDALLKLPMQIVVLGAGDRALERAFTSWARSNPARVAVRLAYDERLAHRMTAAADLQLMPSRFEPCGLNQMYAQRYGTIPVVRRTGGLADTVIDATAAAIADGGATGVHFEHADASGVVYGVQRGIELLSNRSSRAALRRAGMSRDFSWTHSALHYADLYKELVDTAGGGRRKRTAI